MGVPIIAIIGRPNVGKSTLFNRILRKPLAIIADTPGVTRDRNTHEFEWNNRRFLLMDTGGFIISSRDMMEQAVSEQSAIAIEESDVVLFLCDGKTGVADLDSDVAGILRKSGKPVVLGICKIDRNSQEPDIYEFYNLGLGEPMPVSGHTGRGTGDLLDAMVAALPPVGEVRDENPDTVHVALIGRPNVGKSSIVNSITGKQTVLVSDTPGTTRDSVDTRLDLDGTPLILVDTAGLKRVTKLKESLEYYSSLRSIRSLERSDIGIVVVDVSEGLMSYDKRLVNDVVEQGKGLVIAANKWDLVTKDHRTLKEVEEKIYDELPDKQSYPIVFTSALTSQRVRRLLEVAVDIAKRRRFRVQTAELNRFVETLPIPPGSGDVNLYYGTQYGIEPPSFVFFINDVRKVKDNFTRYMEKSLRTEFNLGGTPVKLTFKRRK